jgi:hypothetical protein
VAGLADGALATVPFEALPLGDDVVLARHDVSYAQSLAVVTRSADRAPPAAGFALDTRPVRHRRRRLRAPRRRRRRRPRPADAARLGAAAGAERESRQWRRCTRQRAETDRHRR